MKFQKQLKNVTVWSHHYLPYQKLKRKLRTFFSPPVSPMESRLQLTNSNNSDNGGSNGNGYEYLEILENEIKKVNEFILQERLPIIMNRFEDLKQKFKSIDFSSPFSVYLSVGLMTPQQILQQEEDDRKKQQLQQDLDSISNGEDENSTTPLDQSSSSLYFFSEQQQQGSGTMSVEVDTITAFQIAFEDILKQLAEIDNFSQLNIQAIQKLLNTFSKKKIKSTIYDLKRRKVSQTETTLPKMLEVASSSPATLSPSPSHANGTATPLQHQENQIDQIKKIIANYFKDKVEVLEVYHHTQIKKLTLEIELEYQTICQTNVHLLNNSYYDLLNGKEKELSKQVGLLCRNVATSNSIALVSGIIEEIKVMMKDLKLDDGITTMWIETIHSCIHKSCYLGNVDMVSLLFTTFSNIVNVNHCDEKNKQFIHIAAENGRYEVIEFLIENGADIECLDFLSRRPLHLSSKNGHYDCSNLLLSKSAKVDPLDREGCTPLYLACRQSASSVTVAQPKSVVELLLKCGGLNSSNIRGPYGRHILHEASSKGNVDNISSILNVDPGSANYTDSFGRTPLFESVKNGHLEAISTLLSKNALISTVFDDDKRTLLHEAASNGQLDSMHLLIDNVISTLSKDEVVKLVNQQDDDGWSPLHDACYLNYTRCVKCLLENKSNPNLLDKGEWSPIVHSLYRGNIQAAITIIEYIKKNPELFQESLSATSTPTSLKDSKSGISTAPKLDLNISITNTTGSITIPKSPSFPQLSPIVHSPPVQSTSSVTSSTTPPSTPQSSPNLTGKNKILKSLMSTVQFRVSVVATTIKPGQRVGIVGNRKAIGSWNPSAALLFKEVGGIGNDGCWVGKVQVPVNVQLEYKYVIFEGSRLDTWEALPENRKFTPQEDEEFVDDGIFGQINSDENSDIINGVEQARQQQSVFMERGWLVQDTQIRIRFGETSSTDLQRKMIQPINLYNGKEQAGKIVVSLRDRYSNIQLGTTSSQVNLPLTKDHSVSFQTSELKSKSHHSIQFDIYRRGMSSVLIGRAIVLLSELIATNPYKKVVPIINSSLLSVGELYFFPLIVSPFTHSKLSDVLSNTYWKSTLLIGHRGGGAENARNVGKYKRTHIKENTILSFVTAASLGAQYIEFDVQLSRDNVPVIYHDFEILGMDGIKIPINKIYLEQFKTLQQQNKNNNNNNNGNGNGKNNNNHGNGGDDHNISKTLPSLKSLRGRSKSMQDIFNDIGSSTSSSNILANLRNSGLININNGTITSGVNAVTTTTTPPSSQSPPSQPISDSMTTLEETFKNVPIATGFNIEIKYPNQEKETEIQMNNLNRNAYVDIILKVVFEHAGNRSVMFSSFDADICLLVSLKQPKYPVFFLNNAGFTQHSDPRANSISEAIRFSKSAHLLGIVTNSKILCEAPPIIGQVKSAGLMLCSWGSENNDPVLVDLQEQLGCDGVISDHIAYISKHYYTNNNILNNSSNNIK